MATSPNPINSIPPPPPGFIPEAQANAAPTPPPGFVPENDPMRALSKADAVAPTPKPFTLPWLKDKAFRVASATADALPAIGGTLGGMGGGAYSGGVGAVGGAGLGGIAGESGRGIIRKMLGYPDQATPGERAQEMTKQGAIQGGIQGASELLPFLAPSLKNAATSQYERALAPTTKVNKAISQDIAPELIKRREVGSLQGLENKATQHISEISPQLNTAYGQLQGAGKIAGSGDRVVADLEKLKGSYIDQGVVVQPQAVNAIQGVQDIVKQYGPDMSPNSLRKVRQIFEDPVAQRGGYSGADLSTSYTLNAQKHAADSIRGILNSNPDIGTLNKEISFWLDVQRVTRESGLRQTGQAGGLLKVLTPLASGAAAATTGMQMGAHAGVEAGAATALTTMAYQITRSTAWRTMSAVAKDRFADALARGSVGDVSAIAARLGIAATRKSTPVAQTGLPPILQQRQP